MIKCSVLFCVILLSQCIPEGMWSVEFENKADHAILFKIDVVEENVHVYPIASYDDLGENCRVRKFRAHAPDVYSIPGAKVHISSNDSVSIYAIHPDTLLKYSWEEVRRTKNYWFARVKMPTRTRPASCLYFPFELNGK